MDYLTLFWLFAFGSAFGSFFNVCIYRIPRQLSIVSPPSYCPSCESKISPLQNIPLISYLFLKGKCSNCQEKISPRYPIIELLTAIVTLACYVRFDITAHFFIALTLLYTLIIVIFVDLEFMIIPDSLMIFGFAAVVLFQIAGVHLSWTSFLYGGLFGAGFLLFAALLGKLLFKKDSMGGGDIKLGLVLGLFLGLQNIIIGVFIGFIYAALIAGSLKVVRGEKFTGEIPFGPYLGLGAATSLFFGETVKQVYFNFIGL